MSGHEPKVWTGFFARKAASELNAKNLIKWIIAKDEESGV